MKMIHLISAAELKFLPEKIPNLLTIEPYSWSFRLPDSGHLNHLNDWYKEKNRKIIKSYIMDKLNN